MKPSINNSRVYAILPNAGMCNQFFCWARALVFAKKHNLKLKVHGWSRIRLGPWLRRERIKRYYGGFFLKDQKTLNFYKFWFYKKYLKEKVLNELELDSLYQYDGNFDFVHFHDIPRTQNTGFEYFKELRDNREFIIEELFKIINPKYLEITEGITSPHIGIHIRRGDFQGTPEYLDDDYYINLIQSMRKSLNSVVPVHIFSDGREDELKDILRLENVKLVTGNSDIVDFLLLSKSKIIVASLRSTFSLWAGFISNADLILHPNQTGGRIRSSNDKFFEGTLEEYLVKQKNL